MYTKCKGVRVKAIFVCPDEKSIRAIEAAGYLQIYSIQVIPPSFREDTYIVYKGSREKQIHLNAQSKCQIFR